MHVGFEVHQQLDTHKLFCACPSELGERVDTSIERGLRPTQSELGEIDRAALNEFMKGKRFVYEINAESTCLVEADEEPPHNPNDEAIDIALEVAMLLNASIVDEIHFMRKLVIDGSNTSGFQRTAIVALNGWMDTKRGRVRIPTICLEEEAARKVSEDGMRTVYKLDRLGIPLVEITTSPDITSPEQAREVALKIGELLRATKKVRRGIGTIREDINISIEGGGRVEVKGVQDLNSIPRIIQNEVKRQEKLIGITDELKERGVKSSDVESRVYDVTEAFGKSRSKLISTQLRKGSKVLAIKLKGFKGLMGDLSCALPDSEGKVAVKIKGLGPEFVQHAKVASGVGGILHSDELPAYGITGEEVARVCDRVGLDTEEAFVMVVGNKDAAKKALEAVKRRAKLALKGVPEETRMANLDGTTSYMRPLPGAARMYPETDIAPVAITEERKKRIMAKLPETYEERIKRYIKLYKLSKELASQIVKSEDVHIFEKTVNMPEFVDVPPSIVASTLTGTKKELERENKIRIVITNKKITDMPEFVDAPPIVPILEEKFMDIFRFVSEKKITKEAIPEVLTGISKNPEKEIEEIVEKMGLTSFDEAELTSIVKEVLDENKELIESRGIEAIKPLMGIVMKKVRGRADGKLVNAILRKELEKYLD